MDDMKFTKFTEPYFPYDFKNDPEITTAMKYFKPKIAIKKDSKTGRSYIMTYSPQID